MRLVERYGRGILRAIRSQFDSPLEAVCELVDNALDHSQGQTVGIDVRLSPASFSATNIGGRGMGPAELAGYVAWGGSNDYEAGDRGHYGQGGKAAMCYLGRGFRLWCKRAGSGDAYLLEDPDVLGGAGARDYGELAPLANAELPEDLRGIERGRGFVRVESVGFDSRLAITASGLARDLAAVYTPALRQGAILRVNGDLLAPVNVALDPEFPRLPIDILVEGLRVSGWGGKVLRGANKAHPVKPGFALYWRGRRIAAGTWFGANAYSKGSVASFYGELDFSGTVTPNLNKTGFVQMGEVVWDRLGDLVLQEVAPILDALRGTGGLASVTSRDLRLARAVRAELQEVLRDLDGTDTCLDDDGPRPERSSGDGRVTIVRTGGAGYPGVSHDARGEQDVRAPRLDPRGTRRSATLVLTIPPIVVDAWDAPARSETRDLPEGGYVVAVNKSHPSYTAGSARHAIAEAVIAQIVRRGAGDVGEFLARTDEALATWGHRQHEGEDE